MTLSYWLAASHLPGIGPVTFRRWLDCFPDIKTLFTAKPAELQRVGLSAKEIKLLKNPNWSAVERDIHWSQKPNCHLLSWQDANYPRLLRETIGAPFVLYVQGDVELLAEPQLAIVGSRNPTAIGSETAQQFAFALAEAGFVITSGMALGIDAASHRGALMAKGKTLAVMGTGLEQIYPPSHTELAASIAARGALVSEFPPQTLPKAKHFPLRNRLISGLSLGVLVVEAALRSGSLITARFAVEQGREVFAIPGSIHNPLARGCHFLIGQGAKLVETASDIVEELRALMEMMRPSRVSTLDEKQQELLDKIGYEPTALDAIIIRSGLTGGQVSSMLLNLELAGFVHAVSGGYVRHPESNK